MTKAVERVSFRLATKEDTHLPTYDNTKMAALNTCVTWGILTYAMHKKMPGASRAMPLECGSAMHEVFAWVRLCTLVEQLGVEVGQKAFYYHGVRLFGASRLKEIQDQLPKFGGSKQDFCKQGAIAVLETSGYYDDPSDKRRTLTNMIECSLAYIDKWRWDDLVWMRDPTDPTSDVGIEIPFDVVVKIEFVGIEHIPDNAKWRLTKEFRYTGKIDGIHVQDGVVTLQENKTASRLNDAWSMSFHMASQVTGYCIAASVFTEGLVRNADVLGITVPLPKSYDYGGIVREPVSRQDYHFKQWINWALHTVELYEKYVGNPYDAPKYTHSCNRYFRPCSMIPFCDSEREDQEQTIAEMVTEEWSPLHEKVAD